MEMLGLSYNDLMSMPYSRRYRLLRNKADREQEMARKLEQLQAAARVRRR